MNWGSALGLVAQLVEQRTENPRVGGSIPSQATNPSTSHSNDDHEQEADLPPTCLSGFGERLAVLLVRMRVTFEGFGSKSNALGQALTRRDSGADPAVVC